MSATAFKDEMKLKKLLRDVPNRERLLVFLALYLKENKYFDLVSFGIAVYRAFPPSVPNGTRASEYRDFDASIIRYYLRVLRDDGLAENPSTGEWNLTTSGLKSAGQYMEFLAIRDSIGEGRDEEGTAPNDQEDDLVDEGEEMWEQEEEDLDHLDAQELIDYISTANESWIRDMSFPLPTTGTRDQEPPFIHQQECLDEMRENSPYSGIVHLPTGGGKTEVALREIARFLAEDNENRVIWATNGKGLIRQSMVRLVEKAGLFPDETRFLWGKAETLCCSDVFDRHHIAFATRDSLTKMLAASIKGRPGTSSLGKAFRSPLRRGGRNVMIVYDECHELRAQKLRTAWRKAVRGLPYIDLRLRTLGLSATPMPNAEDAVRFVSKYVFSLPEEPGPVGEKKDWGVLVHKSISNPTLVERSILCPINLYLQEKGIFDIPEWVLEDAGVEWLDTPNRENLKEVEEFAKKFNREVMSSPSVMDWLADRLAENFSALGKTVVFVPTINAANELTARLVDDHRVGRGNVTLVHSKLSDIEDEGKLDHAFKVNTQIDAFVKRRKSPCIMVNVGMLTTGFDDPCIQTIVLARLTFSTNLFWQMIGRGLRGPAVGGTADCQVVDPIQLTSKFEYLQGYRPQFTATGFTALEDGEDFKSGSINCPQVTNTSSPPVLSPNEIVLSNELSQKVATALREFLETGKLTIEDAKLLVENVDVTHGEEGWTYSPRDPHSGAPAGMTLLKQAVRQAEERSGKNLSWFLTPRHLPTRVSDAQMSTFLKQLARIEKSPDILCEEDWDKYIDSLF